MVKHMPPYRTPQTRKNTRKNTKVGIPDGLPRDMLPDMMTDTQQTDEMVNSDEESSPNRLNTPSPTLSTSPESPPTRTPHFSPNSDIQPIPDSPSVGNTHDPPVIVRDSISLQDADGNRAPKSAQKQLFPNSDTNHDNNNSSSPNRSSTNEDISQNRDKMAKQHLQQTGTFPKITLINTQNTNMVQLTKDFHAKHSPMSYSANLVRGKTQTTVSTFKDFANLTRFLDLKGVDFTILKDKPKTQDLVIRGIPPDVGSDTVSHELNKKGIHPTEVITLRSTTGTPYPIYKVSIPEGPEVEKISNLTGLCYYTVRVEPYRSKRYPPQCTRCQQFYHTINTCMNVPRCRKCAGSHLTHNCRQPEDAPIARTLRNAV